MVQYMGRVLAKTACYLVNSGYLHSAHDCHLYNTESVAAVGRIVLKFFVVKCSRINPTINCSSGHFDVILDVSAQQEIVIVFQTISVKKGCLKCFNFFPTIVRSILVNLEIENENIMMRSTITLYLLFLINICLMMFLILSTHELFTHFNRSD